MTMVKRLIRHRKADLSNYAAIPFVQDMVVGSYYVSLVYADLCHRQQIMLTYGERFMDGTCATFRYGLMTSIRKSCKRYNVEEDLWIVSLCQPHSVLYVKTMMVGTFLRMRPHIWIVRGMCQKIMWSSTRPILQLDQLAFSLT